jgi:hypothetical protein
MEYKKIGQKLGTYAIGATMLLNSVLYAQGYKGKTDQIQNNMIWKNKMRIDNLNNRVTKLEKKIKNTGTTKINTTPQKQQIIKKETIIKYVPVPQKEIKYVPLTVYVQPQIPQEQPKKEEIDIVDFLENLKKEGYTYVENDPIYWRPEATKNTLFISKKVPYQLVANADFALYKNGRAVLNIEINNYGNDLPNERQYYPMLPVPTVFLENRSLKKQDQVRIRNALR